MVKFIDLHMHLEKLQIQILFSRILSSRKKCRERLESGTGNSLHRQSGSNQGQYGQSSVLKTVICPRKSSLNSNYTGIGLMLKPGRVNYLLSSLVSPVICMVRVILNWIKLRDYLWTPSFWKVTCLTIKH